MGKGREKITAFPLWNSYSVLSESIIQGTEIANSGKCISFNGSIRCDATMPMPTKKWNFWSPSDIIPFKN
jgi:hypothetical protein